MTRAFNAILRFIFGLLPDGGGRAYFHWQNLREDSRGKPRGFPWEGRAWLRYHHERMRRTITFRFAWNFWSSFCHAGFGVGDGDGDEIGIKLALPPVSIWWSVSGPYWPPRTTDVSIHDWAIWWNVWNDDNNWNSRDPWWKRGCFHLNDFFLGKTNHSSETLSTHEVVIPMPEGNYPATVVLSEDTWRRPRWFPMRLRRAKVDLKTGIPFHGKGENSWDCGDDALHGMSCLANNPEQAIAATMEAAMRNRRRYGSGVMEKWPAPKAVA